MTAPEHNTEWEDKVSHCILKSTDSLYPDIFLDPYNMPGNRMHNYKSTKEANLMPVPSPQQIQFPLLDGQELTIQKQPNTSLRDSDLVSPS